MKGKNNLRQTNYKMLIIMILIFLDKTKSNVLTTLVNGCILLLTVVVNEGIHLEKYAKRRLFAPETYTFSSGAERRPQHLKRGKI
ncbi:MAG: hypothetical protein K0R71_551 [Bacillales bacterium]|nr:hypothetical protein [Bacillales bacterium]